VSRALVPIFPLPDLTFFPHTLLPLHIFEARYRAMVTDCLARDKRMAVVGLKPGYEASYEGKPAVHEIAGLGRIVQCERLASGRFNLVLKGESRVRIERELPADTLYRLVAATPLDEVGADRPSVGALVTRVTFACGRGAGNALRPDRLRGGAGGGGAAAAPGGARRGAATAASRRRAG